MRARVASALAAAILPTVFLPAVLSAQGGELTFTPERARPGGRVEVAYEPSSDLAGEPELRLRARLRTPGDPSYNRTMTSRTVAELAPDGHGVYRGAFVLPDSVVYGAFAVEDTAAATTDTREGAFWELMAHGGDGRPLFRALVQRGHDYMGRDLHGTLETARTMVRIHPDRLRGWDMLQAAETWIFRGRGDGPHEGRRDTLRALVARLDSTLAGRDDVPVDQVAYMARYADEYADEEVADRWEERWRAVREHRPGHPLALHDRLGELLPELRDDPGELLDELDALWEAAEAPRARRILAVRGFRAARRLGEREPLIRWADRYRAHGRSGARGVVAYRTLLSTEATRAHAVEAAREEVERLLDPLDATRRLGETRAGHRDRMTSRAATLRAAIGEALLAEGRPRQGLEALERAAAVGWDTDRHRALAEARLEAGDREGATEALAAVAADPATPPGAADSLRRQAAVDPATWERAVERARKEMIERTLASSRDEEVGAPEALSPDGTRVRLDERLGEEATVVVHWSRSCHFSRRAMPKIVERAEELAARGVPLLAVTGDAPEEAKEYLREEDLRVEGGALEVLFDVDGEVVNEIGSWGTPQYFVLDGAGRLRFVSSLADLPRHVAALRAEAVGATARR
jgi:peroxiredoxin